MEEARGRSAGKTARPIPVAAGLLIVASILFCYNRLPAETVAVLASALRQSTPLVLGALCGLLAERSGIINIGIEGQMLSAAFLSFMVNVWTGNLALAVAAGMVAGAAMGQLMALMSVTLKMDQIIGGTVINILALGVTGYLYQPGMTTQGKLQAVALGPLKAVPLVGPVLFNNPPLTYLAPFLVLGVHFLMFHTRWGLRTRAIGEHPRAADTMGVRVYRMQYMNLALGGVIVGLAGAFLTLEAVGSFERGMTNGRGFVALAIMIFGRWRPMGAWGGALLFGLASAFQTQLQFMGQLQIPHQFIGMLPYLLTVVVLALFVGRSRPPAGLGRPYRKE